MSDDERKKLDELVKDYGNAVFDCGEYDHPGGKPAADEYAKLLEISRVKRQALLDFCEKLKP